MVAFFTGRWYQFRPILKSFKKYLNVNSQDYELLSDISLNSDNIEVLFVERTKQILKSGGVAGIILPRSILDNSDNLYTRTREVILKYFEIIAIVELGGPTFSATSNKTITAFLKRRSDDFAQNCQFIAEDIILENKERKDDFINSRSAFESYVSTINLNVSDYETLVAQSPNDDLKATEFYKTYLEEFESSTALKRVKERASFKALPTKEQEQLVSRLFFEYILGIEKDKFLYFLLSHKLIKSENDKFSYVIVPQKTVIITTGTKTSEQKKFLGYKFSDRKGYQGIDLTIKNGKHDTKLYDPEKNLNPEKVNYYIYNNFLHKEQDQVDEFLKENVTIYSLPDLIDFEKSDFDKAIVISGIIKIDYETLWGTDKLTTIKKLANVVKGTSITEAQTILGKIPVVAGGQEPAYYHSVHNRAENVITISASGAYAGFANYWGRKIFASDCSTVISKEEKAYPTKLIFHYLKHIQVAIYMLQRGSGQPHVYPKDIEKIKIPDLTAPTCKAKLAAVEKIIANRSKYLESGMKPENLHEKVREEIGKILLKNL